MGAFKYFIFLSFLAPAGVYTNTAIHESARTCTLYGPGDGTSMSVRIDYVGSS